MTPDEVREANEYLDDIENLEFIKADFSVGTRQTSITRFCDELRSRGLVSPSLPEQIKELILADLELSIEYCRNRLTALGVKLDQN